MTDLEGDQKTPALQGNIRWHHYNYPPLLRLVHFVPSQLPKHKKFISMSLFILHLIILANSVLNLLDNCFQGGLRVLYAFLLLLFINPTVLLVFSKGFMGICRESSHLRIYFILQPIISLLLILISIVGVFGLNGFVRAHYLFGESKGFAGILSVLVSLIFLAAGLFSTFIYIRIYRQKEVLTSDL